MIIGTVIKHRQDETWSWMNDFYYSIASHYAIIFIKLPGATAVQTQVHMEKVSVGCCSFFREFFGQRPYHGHPGKAFPAKIHRRSPGHRGGHPCALVHHHRPSRDRPAAGSAAVTDLHRPVTGGWHRSGRRWCHGERGDWVIAGNTSRNAHYRLKSTHMSSG